MIKKKERMAQVESPDDSTIIPMLEELGIDVLEQVVNRFLVISEHQLTEYDGRHMTTRSQYTLRCKHPSVTMTVFGMDVDWPN